MKRKTVLLWGCIFLSLLFSGCRGFDRQENDKISEKITESETEKSADRNPAVGLGNLASSGSAPNTTVLEQTEAVVQTEGIQIEAMETELLEPETSPRTYEEEYMQCPYCAHWFSTLPDGGSSSPYDRHLMEERETDAGGGTTEAELVQCENCGNWYPAGNVFRNHICEGIQ